MIKGDNSVDIVLDDLLRVAVQVGASDLHLSVSSPPMVRVHGFMVPLKGYENVELSAITTERVLFQLTDLGARSSVKSDGQYDTSYLLQGVGRFRVNIFSQKSSYAGVFRVLPTRPIGFENLNLPSSILNLHKKKRGLVLVVGATGSGKSTTLASFLDVINKEDRKHIITLEQPIEYIHKSKKSLFAQREIPTDCVSFEEGLRAALREDPDVILVGEMRDVITTDTALAAAETGHLVCSTLHTIGAAETVNRVLNMYSMEVRSRVQSQLATTLEAVISQQLLPRKDGKGYIVAYEILYKNKEVVKYIQRGNIEGLSDYLKTEEAKSEGMCAMDDTIVSLYKRGAIDKEVALDYSLDRKEMTQRLGM